MMTFSSISSTAVFTAAVDMNAETVQCVHADACPVIWMIGRAVLSRINFGFGDDLVKNPETSALLALLN